MDTQNSEKNKPKITDQAPLSGNSTCDFDSTYSSEPDSNSADNSLGRPNDKDLVVHRRIEKVLTKQTPDRHQHLELRPGKIQERQCLCQLNVESRTATRRRRSR